MTAFCTQQLHFLSQADETALVGYLTEEVDSEQQGIEALRWVKAHRPAMFNAVLCLLYDISCYQVGESCFRDRYAEHMHKHWFLSLPVPCDLVCWGDEQLMPSKQDAEALAVSIYRLEAKFFGEDRRGRLIAA